MSKIVTGEDNGTISSEDTEKYAIKEEEVKENGIPDFWLNVLVNSKFFEINDKDKEIIKLLKNVTLELSETLLDFTVKFHFEKNDYFEEETLFKTFFYDVTTFETNKANSTVVTWKEGKNPALKIKTKKIKSKNFI
jgi:nucleosome assembly protein 1-like 1